MSGFRQAMAFLTPVGGAVAPGPTALVWFPAVGALIGLAVGGVWWGAHHLWPPAVAAVLAVVADLALTGILHFDGLCDAADGLLPPLERERRLSVMAQPDAGAFGVAVVAVALLARWAALALLAPAPLLIAGLWVASRAGMAAVATGLPYAREEGGMATAFREGTRPAALPIAAAGLVGAALLAAVWRPAVGPVSVGVACAGMALVVWLAWRRIGGFTGDVLGAAGVVGETVGLLAACARW